MAPLPALSWRRARTLTAGITAQGAASLANLLVSVVVARRLGAVAFGRFAVLFALLTFCTAVITGWIGDSLTVQAARGGYSSSAILVWQHRLTAVTTVVSLAAAWFVGVGV